MSEADSSVEEATFGQQHADGFSEFRSSGLFADTTVVTADGQSYKLHGLLLAKRSEFFQKALSSEFTEGRTKRIELGDLEHAQGAWPALLDYFYTDRVTLTEANVLGLLALSRRLLVPAVDSYCLSYVRQRLDVRSCIAYLKEAVLYALHDLQRECVALAAGGFPVVCDADVSGLPPSSILDILHHPGLVVHCELQVLHFVLKYLGSTQVEPEAVRRICGQIRFVYLDNVTLGALSSNTLIPRDLLLEGSLLRLGAMDSPALELASLTPPPRSSYCCNLRYGLPGGSQYLTIDLEAVWERLAKMITVRVSGINEGNPRNILSSEPDGWFETNESSDPLPWIELHMPHNVQVTNLMRYTFQHGHRRSGYYRMRNWKTLTAKDVAGPFTDLSTRVSPHEQFDVHVASAHQTRLWRALRLTATERQEDGVYRLCLRNLRLLGSAQVDLLNQAGGLVVDSSMCGSSSSGSSGGCSGGGGGHNGGNGVRQQMGAGVACTGAAPSTSMPSRAASAGGSRPPSAGGSALHSPEASASGSNFMQHVSGAFS